MVNQPSIAGTRDTVSDTPSDYVVPEEPTPWVTPRRPEVVDAKIRRMVDDSTATRSATELAAGIRAKEWSSRELLELYLDRIDRLDGPVNAVVTLDADRARGAADAADAALARGDDLGPLHGLPVTIKDAIETEGIRSTGGARELLDHVPTVDAPAVARLKDAGAIVFGKTNLPRWSADFQTYNEIFGVTNNPWDLSRTTGGSSGGAAAAVAAGFTSFELGTDIGGSVRIPSHCCGTFGLKPSFGVISATRLPVARRWGHDRRRHQRVRPDGAQRRRPRPAARRARRSRAGARRRLADRSPRERRPDAR